MKNLIQRLTLPTVITALVLSAGAALGQATIQTPLTASVQQSGTVNPSRSTSCGFLPNGPTQTLQVNEEFASMDMSISGDSGITFYIEGSNGFKECFTTDNLSGSTINAPGLLNRGTYSLFVGNSNQVTTNYTLTIQQN
jgi:hypothetical protein